MITIINKVNQSKTTDHHNVDYLVYLSQQKYKKIKRATTNEGLFLPFISFFSFSFDTLVSKGNVDAKDPYTMSFCQSLLMQVCRQVREQG